MTHKIKIILIIIILGFCTKIIFGQDTMGQPYVNVFGKVIPSSGSSIPTEEVTVVLLKYKLNEQGNLQPLGPLARSKTKNSGQYSFKQIPLDSGAAYKIGSRFQGQLVSSDYFFMKPGEIEINVDLAIPGISENTEQLSIPNIALVIEPGVGLLQITEVLRVLNPTRDIIDTSKTPLVFKIPESSFDFSMMGEPEASVKDYNLLGQDVQYFKQFPPGLTTIAYRYQLNVRFGQLEVTKDIIDSYETIRILIPDKKLSLESKQLTQGPLEVLGDIEFKVFELKNIDQKQLSFNVSGVSLEHIDYIYFGLVLVIVLAMLAFGYIRWKIPKY